MNIECRDLEGEPLTPAENFYVWALVLLFTLLDVAVVAWIVNGSNQ